MTGLQREVLDSYWTQVIYHNSRQELGKTTTLLRDDVDTRIKILEKDSNKQRKIASIVELSANLKGGKIREALDQLNNSYGTDVAIDVLPCTNMLSVGVDSSRLGLMIMKGQPKSTAAYIQATSRVGRDSKRPPGLVITLHSPTRPRDRSHYETLLISPSLHHVGRMVHLCSQSIGQNHARVIVLFFVVW